MFEVTVGYGMDALDAPERLCNEARFQKCGVCQMDVPCLAC